MHVPSEEVDFMEGDASLPDAIPRRCEADWWWVLPRDLPFHHDSIIEFHPHFEGEFLWHINQFCTAIHSDHFQTTLAHSCLALAGNVPSQIVDIVCR